MAEETDAARDRVLAARAILGEELDTLEASARAAVDIPARIRRSPVKAAGLAGGAAFVVLRGPQRVFRAGKRAIFGAPDPLPESMLPDDVERAIRALGDDGAKVRGALERDFAAYAKQAGRDRARLRTLLLLSVVRPMLYNAAKFGGKWVFSTDDEGFQTRLAQIRQRAGQRGPSDAASAADPGTVAGEGTALD